jgi:glycosyltransferase involved in cell wall biosynthesis
MKAMRIALTVHQFFPEYTSGTEVLTLGVARELRRRGHQVFVLTGHPESKRLVDEARFDDYEFDGIKVFRFHHGYQPMGRQDIVTEVEYNNLLAAAYFAKIIKKMLPEVIHFFHLSRLGATLIDVAIQEGIAAYYTPTDFWAVCPLSQLLFTDGKLCGGPSPLGGNCIKHMAELTSRSRVNWLLQRLPTALVDTIVGVLTKTKLASAHPFGLEAVAMAARPGFIVGRLNCLEAIFAPTQHMRQILVGRGVDKSRIILSSYGIGTSQLQRNPKRTAPSAERTFAFIGTLSPHKGCHILLEAFKRLNVPGVRLRIYGNLQQFPSYGAKLRTIAEQIDTIEFCGTFPEERIGDVLGECDALVVPSLWYENTPLVIYSALAARCPVIGSDFPGISEVIRPNENGLLFAAGNVESLCSKLLLLLRTPGLLAQLQAGCKPPKSISTYVEELETAYMQGLKARTSLRRPRDLLRIAPLGKPYSYMAGWAAVAAPTPQLYREVFRWLTGRKGTRFTTPASIAILVDGTCVSEAKWFSVRPDIREGFLAHGSRAAAVKFGFVLRLPHWLKRDVAALEIRYADGRRVRTPLQKVPVGTSIRVGDDAFVGVEEERIVCTT